MKLRPILNPDNPPTGAMFEVLNWFETLCRMRGKTEVTEDEVLAFLIAEDRLDLAKAFVRDYFCELPDAPQ